MNSYILLSFEGYYHSNFSSGFDDCIIASYQGADFRIEASDLTVCDNYSINLFTSSDKEVAEFFEDFDDGWPSVEIHIETAKSSINIITLVDLYLMNQGYNFRYAQPVDDPWQNLLDALTCKIKSFSWSCAYSDSDVYLNNIVFQHDKIEYNAGYGTCLAIYNPSIIRGFLSIMTTIRNQFLRIEKIHEQANPEFFRKVREEQFGCGIDLRNNI